MKFGFQNNCANFLAKQEVQRCLLASDNSVRWQLLWLGWSGEERRMAPCSILGMDLPLTQQRFVAEMRSVLHTIGEDPKKFGGHSFRSGAATTAALVIPRSNCWEDGIAQHTRPTSRHHQPYW